MRPLTTVLFLFSVVLFSCQSNAQLISGKFENMEASKVYLYSTIGHTYKLIDSSKVSDNGDFEFEIAGMTSGFYQLALNDSDVVDIIINTMEPGIQLSFAGTPLQENILIESSDENHLLWEYKRTSREAQAKDIAFRQQKYALPQTDSLGRAQVELLRTKNQGWKKNRLNEITSKMPNSYFAKIIKLAEDLELLAGQNTQVILAQVAYDDPEFLRSSTYSKGLLTYLRAIPLESEEDFMRQLDMLLDETKGNSECRNYALSYFIDLFGQSGPELAFQHIVSTHVEDADMEDLDPELRERIRKIQTLGLGATAPNIMLPDMKGDSLSLESVATKNVATCLFFYSSSCDHCHDQIPGLKILYAGLKDEGFDVIGIALDTDTVEFTNCLIRFGVPWPSYTEQLAWGSPAANAFEIAATPSFYLIDSEMKIMAKPSSSRALKDLLKRIPEFQKLNDQQE